MSATDFDEIRDAWIGVGRLTAPTDRPAAEERIREAYRVAGLVEPDAVVWTDSPRGAILAVDQLFRDLDRSENYEYSKELEASSLEIANAILGRLDPSASGGSWAEDVWKEVRSRIWTGLRPEYRLRLSATVCEALKYPGMRAVSPCFRDPLEALDPTPEQEAAAEEVERLVDMCLGNLIGTAVGRDFRRDPPSAVLCDLPPVSFERGPHHVAHLAMVEMAGERRGDIGIEILRAQIPVARALGGWFPLYSAVVAYDRPCHLGIDDEGRFHSELGPAAQWRDGWRFWAHHGVLVPEDVIDRPEEMTPRSVIEEENVEVRRVRLEKYPGGLDRFLRDADARRLDMDPAIGTLYRVDGYLGEPFVAVRLLNSTVEPDGSRMEYLLRVPPNTYTAREAVAWTFGMNKEEYAPEIES